MTKVEDRSQESNDNESSEKSNTSKESDIKDKIKKNHNRKKAKHSDDINLDKMKRATVTFWKEPCREILETLKKDKKAVLFRAPAVKAFQDQKDKEFYKNQIKEPRDLGTITKKLNGDKYTPKEFYNDIKLCWTNALTFNEDDTEVYKCALYLQDLADKLFKEKNINDIIDRYNNTDNITDDKDLNTNDNTNNSNNNTNDSNNPGDKINLNESGLLENGLKEKNGVNNGDNDNIAKKEKERKDSIDSNSSDKSKKEKDKDDDSYNESEHKKHHHHHKMTGKKRRRHKHHDKDKDKDKDKIKEENNDEEKKEKKRGRKRKKIDNDDIIKISKKKINFDDLKKKYPINYPVILSPEEIERTAKKNGKKIKKMVKLNNFGKNHDNNHHKSENHKKRAKNANNNNNNTINITNINTINTTDKCKNITYKYEVGFLGNANDQKINCILIDNNIVEDEKRRMENKNMANYDVNCNTEDIQVIHKYRNTNNNTNNNNTNNVNGINENTQKKKKNDVVKNKNNYINNKTNNSINISNNNNNNNINNNNSANINYISLNNNENEESNNINIINNQETITKSNNISIDNSINEIRMIPEINTSVKIVDKGYEKSMESRIEIARYFDNLTDSNMIDLLVYIENIRPQSIRILENDTIYIDMEAFNEDTFSKVIEYIKNFVE